MLERHLLFVASKTDLIPVFEPFVKLVNYSAVAYQIVDTSGFVLFCPHLTVSNHFFDFFNDVGFWYRVEDALLAHGELKIRVTGLVSNELFELVFVVDGSSFLLCSFVFVAGSDFSSIFEFFANNQNVGFTTNRTRAFATMRCYPILKFLSCKFLHNTRKH